MHKLHPQSFLVRNPEEELNIAVAGPAHFYMRRDGITFWPKTIDGVLFHHTDSLPRRLFPLQANIWYVVDVVFHVEAGTYDLRILSPQASTLPVLHEAQPNAINAPGSKLLFSLSDEALVERMTTLAALREGSHSQLAQYEARVSRILESLRACLSPRPLLGLPRPSGKLLNISEHFSGQRLLLRLTK